MMTEEDIDVVNVAKMKTVMSYGLSNILMRVKACRFLRFGVTSNKCMLILEHTRKVTKPMSRSLKPFLVDKNQKH